MDIGEIGNYYGSLEVKEEDGKYYWGIEDWDGTAWEEIPKELYDALVKYETERKSAQRSDNKPPTYGRLINE